MTERDQHDKVAAQILVDGLGLGRALDDYDVHANKGSYGR
jgi:hypothetical protein